MKYKIDICHTYTHPYYDPKYHRCELISIYDSTTLKVLLDGVNQNNHLDYTIVVIE